MNKRIAGLLLISALILAGCSNEKPVPTEAQTEPTVATETTATEAPVTEPTQTGEVTEEPTETVELSYDAYQVLYTYVNEDNEEYYLLQGIDHQGNLIWSKETEHLAPAQLPRVSHIGTYEGKYFYCEDGTVIALDVTSGEVLWKNGDFGGSFSEDTAALIDSDGFIYLCGALGPDFIAIDVDGKTVKKIDSFSNVHSGAYRIDRKGEKLVIHLSDGPDGNVGDDGYIFEVEMDWLPELLG